VNTEASGEYASAQLKQYYSTLDGYGQRHQHQVLLDRTLHGETSHQNKLYQTMPRVALEAMLDLFMAATGPNVRAKLCHGEANLVISYYTEMCYCVLIQN